MEGSPLKINDSNPHYPQNSTRYTLKANGIRLGPIHTRHFRAQYCDKKDIFGPWMSIGQKKALKKQGVQGFNKSLPWLFYRNLLLKNVKCCNIFLFFYRIIVWKIFCLNRA